MTAKKQPSELISLTLILFLFSAVTPCSWACQQRHRGPDCRDQRQKTKSAMQEVLMAENYEKVNYAGEDPTVVGVYKAGDAGFVVELSVSGSQAMVNMVVGVDPGGTVTGVGITKHTETPGLGAVAADNTDAGKSFREQFAGTVGNLSVNKDGGTIAALPGATITSRAVTNGVNSAVEAVKSLG
jgi:electron transport complex protein RnfG